MDERYSELIALIESNPDVVEFAPYGEGVSEEWIKKTEDKLQFPLPDSYKWWCRNFGGGEICGEEIFSIYASESEAIPAGDIAYNYFTDQKNGTLSKDQMAVCDSDIDGTFFFDLRVGVENNEYPVVSAATDKVYAKDFLDFLKIRIEISK